MHEVLGRSPVPDIAHTDRQQPSCKAVIQLLSGRTVAFSAPFGQYLFLHLHRLFLHVNAGKAERLRGMEKNFRVVQYSRHPPVLRAKGNKNIWKA